MTSTATRVGERGGIPLAKGWRLYSFILDITSYPTNGESVAPSVFGLQKVRSVKVQPSENIDRGTVWDRTNSKLKVFVCNTGAEAANTTDQGEFLVEVLGR
jgi:hypothetical protein